MNLDWKNIFYVSEPCIEPNAEIALINNNIKKNIGILTIKENKVILIITLLNEEKIT